MSGAATGVCKTGLAFAAALRLRRRRALPRGLAMTPGRRLREAAVRQPHSQENFDGESRILGDVSSRTCSGTKKRILYQAGRQIHPLSCAQSMNLVEATICVATKRKGRVSVPVFVEIR
jgi:hypothetical protein